MANSLDPDQTAPIGAICSGSTLIASILNSSVMLGTYLQQRTSADDIFRCIFFLGALRVNICYVCSKNHLIETVFEYPQHMFWLRNKKINFLSTLYYLL